MQGEERTSDLLPWGNISARQTVGLQPLSAPGAAPDPCFIQEFGGVCVLPKLPSSCPTPTEMNSQLPHRSLAIDGPVRDGQQDWGAEDGGP